jgi:hypothetical protein
MADSGSRKFSIFLKENRAEMCLIYRDRSRPVPIYKEGGDGYFVLYFNVSELYN